MVKLDVTRLKFMEDDDFRVLTALEMALRNHDVAPTVLIERIAGLPHGGAKRRLGQMLKAKLIHHESLMYDGFAMKYSAYDYLAIRTFSKRGTVKGVGCRVGCGKESDIYVVQDENGNDAIMKLQRLGRCSFRTVAKNRDYKGGLKKRRGASWFYLSRLAAQKEFAFMKLLHDEGFPVPKPIDQNRHAIIMEFVNATLLNHIEALADAQKVYERCLALIVKLAQAGLVHGDFNEFNLFVNNDMQIIMIDFPQMVSIDHPNASELFDRDINNLALFFERRFGLKTKYFPKLETDVERAGSLDRTAIASGSISKQQLKDMEMLKAEQDEEEAEEEEEEEIEEEEEEEDDEEESKKPAAAANDDDENQPAVTTTRAPQKFVSLAHLAKGSDFENLVSTQLPTTAATTTTPVAVKTDKPEKKQQQEKQKVEEGAEKNDDEDEEDDEEESDEEDQQQEQQQRPLDSRSVATTVAPQMLSKELIKNRVKNQLQKQEDESFKRNMHRNCQKGKEKVRIKKQVKAHMTKGDAQDYF